MLTLSEFINNFSREYHVSSLDDDLRGSIVAHITGDIYLIHTGEVKE